MLSNEGRRQIPTGFITEALKDQLTHARPPRDQLKVEWSKVDHLKSDLAGEASMNRRSCQMHNEAEPCEGASAFYSSGKTRLSFEVDSLSSDRKDELSRC